MKVTAYSFFAVEGRGRFPKEMLEYDECEPHGLSNAAAIEAESDETRRVILRMENEGYGFTPERWRSLGWPVVACAKTMEELAHGLRDNRVPFAPPHNIYQMPGGPVIFQGFGPIKNQASIYDRPLGEALERKKFDEWFVAKWRTPNSVNDFRKRHHMWLAWEERAKRDCDGDVVVTRKETGEVVLVARYDEEGRLLKVIWEAA